MSDFDHTTSMACDPGSPGAQLWSEVQDLVVAWANAERMGDADGAARIEQGFRRVALAYTTLSVDAQTTTTGRKAIVRSVVARFGSIETVDLLAKLDAVIRHEEATARRIS